MTAKDIVIQLIGLAGTVLYFLSFQCKDNRKLYAVQFLSYVFYTVHFLLLGAVTGGISYLLNLARSFFLAGSWKFGRSKKMCIILCSLQAVTAVTTWAGWISLLPTCANIASTIGGYTHNARKIRIASMFFNSPLWIVYNIIVGSWVGVLDELASEVSGVISICRYGWKNLDEVRD